jgi:Tfp pilus assembly protein FimV
MKYFAAVLLLCAQAVTADSTRIEVYPISQNYYDAIEGDALGEIVARLLPDTPNLREHLMREIVDLNPDAFIAGDPNRLLANTRLWLPNALEQPTAESKSTSGSVENYSWGSIRRPKQRP